MTKSIEVDNLPETQFFDPPSNPADDQDLANFLASLETIPVDSTTFQKLANQSPARRYRATHLPYNPNRELFVPAPIGFIADLNAMRTFRRGRRTVTTFPHHPLSYYPRPLRPIIRATRKLDRAIAYLCPDPLAFTALGILSLCALLVFAIACPAQAPSLEALDHPHKACKTVSDKEPRVKPKIVFTTKQSFTLVLKDCRENDKHHVSCQFVDATGQERWLYIPGLTIPHDDN
jgi:hypothetical protein